MESIPPETAGGGPQHGRLNRAVKESLRELGAQLSLLNHSVGTRLDLKIFLPKGLRDRFRGQKSYEVRGLVSRIERSPDASRYRVGVKMLGELEPNSPRTA